ncbi:NUDIX hydrolase [Beijerinckiaceae bacterium]|nr:NUDIX hydrolase [Beijerinckiaceae bacterium]
MTEGAVGLQYGALPYRFSDSGALEILLVTTRRTKRWMIPKGWPIKGLKGTKSAAREAYEEAGVQGSIRIKATGVFSYAKRFDDCDFVIPCEVLVFPLLVKRQNKTWPESRQRQTRWFTPEEALSAICEESLRGLIASLVREIRNAACSFEAGAEQDSRVSNRELSIASPTNRRPHTKPLHG